MNLKIGSEKVNNLSKRLKEVCFDMRLLIVEDDTDLANQLRRFLSKFFGKIDTAANGMEALKIYKENSYELIITDLSMPIMGGIELIKNIRETSDTQSILIMSAYFENHELLKLINMGIDGFLTKPVDIETTLAQLAKTTQAIYNDKLLKLYGEMLEEANEELIKSNTELENSLKKLQQKGQAPVKEEYTQEHKEEKLEQKQTQADIYAIYKSSKMSASEFFDAFPFELEKTNEDLELLEDNFNIAFIRAENNVKKDDLVQFVDIMKSYARTIELIPQFGALSYGIQQLAKTFDQITDPMKLHSVLPMLTHLFDNLEQWRKSVFYYRDAEDIHYMDDSLISDAQSLQGFLSDTHSKSSDFEMELF